MPNKNQIQKDFYTKMNEWKEQYKSPNKNQFLYAQTDFNENIRKSAEKVDSLAGEEYMKHIEEINSKIDENRKANAGAIANAKNCIVSKSEGR